MDLKTASFIIRQHSFGGVSEEGSKPPNKNKKPIKPNPTNKKTDTVNEAD